MKYLEAQNNMNYAYFGGAPGVLISGSIWCLAGIIALVSSAQHSMLALFFGGMFIHPVAVLLAKSLGRPGAHLAENPLGKLALECTALLFIGLFIAFFVASLQANWFYPIMLMMIGGRYLIFNTLYGLRIYWLLALLLIGSGMFSMAFNAPFAYGAFIGGGLELLFAMIIAAQVKNNQAQSI